MNNLTLRPTPSRDTPQSWISRTVSSAFVVSEARPIQRHAIAKIIVSLLLLIGPAKESRADAPQSDQEKPSQLKQLSLEQLGNIEVTTTSKEPVKVIRSPAAVYVLTQEDIRRSGAWRRAWRWRALMRIIGPSRFAGLQASSQSPCWF